MQARELSPEWNIKLEKLYDLGMRRLARARKSFYKPVAHMTKEWDARFYRLIEKGRLKASGRSSVWNRRLDILKSSWNIWFYELQLIRKVKFTPPKRYTSFESRFTGYIRQNWNYQYYRQGWRKAMLDFKRDWAHVSRRIQGGFRMNSAPKVVNERVTIKDMRNMLEKQNYRCALTGRKLTPENCAMDHIVPLAHGGAHSIENAQLVVSDANNAKGILTMEEFIELCRDVVRHAEKKKS